MNLKKEAEKLFQGILARHRGRLPGKVVLTRYESEAFYRKLRPGDELTFEEQAKLTAAVADLFKKQGVKVVYRTLTEAEYLADLDAKGRVDSPDNRADFVLRRRGGQPGNRNAAKSEKNENDGQFLLHLPRELRERGKKAAKASGDGGLSQMLRRLLREELKRLNR